MKKALLKKILAIFLFLIPNCWGYAWQFNTGTNTDTTGTTTASVTTTAVGGMNAAIICQIEWLAPVTGVSVKWDPSNTNQSMSLIKTYTNSNNQMISLYGLVAPTGGTKTMTATWTTSTECIMQAVSFTGVNQAGGTTSFANATSNNGSSSSPSITITSATGDITVDLVGCGNNASTAACTPFSTVNFTGAGSITMGGAWGPGSSSVNMPCTLNNSDIWGMVGTDIVAASANIVAVSGVSPVVSNTSGKITITSGKITIQ